MTANDIDMFSRVYGLDLARLPDEDDDALKARISHQLERMDPSKKENAMAALRMWLFFDREPPKPARPFIDVRACF